MRRPVETPLRGIEVSRLTLFAGTSGGILWAVGAEVMSFGFAGGRTKSAVDARAFP